LLRCFCRALSRRDYNQLSSLEPGLGLAHHLWRRKELRARQPLHDLPAVVGKASRRRPNSAPDRGHLMACLTEHASTNAVWPMTD
jgi:hypothetical protein